MGANFSGTNDMLNVEKYVLGSDNSINLEVLREHSASNKDVKKMITSLLTKDQILQETEELLKLCQRLLEVENPESDEYHNKYKRGIYLLRYTNLKTLFGNTYPQNNGTHTDNLRCDNNEKPEQKKEEIKNNIATLNNVMKELREYKENKEKYNEVLEKMIEHYSTYYETGKKRGGGPSGDSRCFLPMITIAIVILLIILVIIVMFMPDLGRQCDDWRRPLYARGF